MKTLRPVLIALVALAMIAAPGCRTGGLGNLSKPPGLLPPGSNETAAELLVEHNRNAGRVQSLKARPEIKIDDRRRFFGASGKLAIERPKNFKLELSVAMANAADIDTVMAISSTEPETESAAFFPAASAFCVSSLMDSPALAMDTSVLAVASVTACPVLATGGFCCALRPGAAGWG